MKNTMILMLLFVEMILSMNGFSQQTKGLSGDIYVGNGQTYTTFTRNDGNGFFAALNNLGMDGNITVYVTSNITETGEIALTGADGTYSITIKPSDAQEREITGFVSNSRGVLHLMDAHAVTIDGSYMGSGNYIKIYNSYAAGNSIGLQISGGAGSGSSDITIRNCNIGSGKTTSGAYAVYIGGMNVPNGGNIHDITLENNLFFNSNIGLYIKGLNDSRVNEIAVLNNTFGKTGGLIGSTAILAQYCQNLYVNENVISNFTTDIENKYGIMLGIGVMNTTLSRNSIFDVVSTRTGNGSKAIVINTYNTASDISIINNVIYNIKGYGDSNITNINYGANVGIGVYGATGDVKLYYNSVYLYGLANRNQSTISACLYLSDQSVAIDVRNNIFYNQLLNNLSASAKAYALYVAGSKTIFSEIDYNDYYVSGDQGVLGFLSGDLSTLGAIQTATSGDLNSLTENPEFRSFSELQPLSGSAVLGAAVPLLAVTTDFTGIDRDLVNPSMGAYEQGFVLPAVDWCNLQSPASANQNEGAALAVYARVYEDGITNGAGQGVGITAWIGYSTVNSNPNTWTDWIAADYNADYGDDDEYWALLPGTLTAGTYYYASRFRVEGGNFQYGGYSSGGGGFWDGTSYVSGQLDVADNSISWANLQHPENQSIQESESITVYARLFADGVTTQGTPSEGVQVWAGWSEDNTDPAGWDSWEAAAFNMQVGNNHEYVADISFPFEGTFYYATRFKLCEDDFVYGGYNSAGGGLWDGNTNLSGVLTVNPLLINVPYTQDFEGLEYPELPAGWRAEDVNEDGYSWYTNDGYATIDYNSSAEMDDWLFSPGINLSAGVTYFISFSYSARDSYYPEKLELRYGSQRNAAAMGEEVLFSNTHIVNSMFNTAFIQFEPATTAVYYFGWHGFSEADMYGIDLDDFSIEMANSWVGSQSNLWSDPLNWTSGQVPDGGSAVSIKSPKEVIVDLAHARCYHLYIQNGAQVIIQPNKGLEVSGILNNPAEESGILVLSDASGTGSLLHNTPGVKGVFQRYIAAADWNNHQDGWHIVSSPVFQQPISGDWTPTEADDDYDFFLWDGEAVEWLNQKDPANGITHFDEGISYLVAYQQSRSHIFSGVLNVDYVSHNLAINTDSWLPIGNPYSTALIWNNAEWMLDGFAAIAKVWRRETKSYVDVQPGGIIPATNGFMGFGECIGTVVNLQMTISPYARTINHQTAFYKSGSWPSVYLVASEADNSSSQESCFVVHPEATTSFTKECDSKFNPGYAPEFYSVKAGEAMSTYAFQDFSDKEVQLVFKPNQAVDYFIKLDKERTNVAIQILLTDLKTGETRNLTENPVYNFQADQQDEPERFLLQFGPVGQDEHNQTPAMKLIKKADKLLISNPGGNSVLQIFDLQGRLILSKSITENQSEIAISGFRKGIYLVRLSDTSASISEKIIIH